MRRIAPSTVLFSLIMTLLAIVPRPLEAQVGAITFGVALDRLLDKVGGLVTAAQNAGSILEVGAGGQIAQAIEYAKHSYEHELTNTMDQLTAEQKKVLDDLTSQVGALEQKTYEHLREIVDHGALIANVVPFSKTFPQVSRYAPYFVVPSLSNATLFTIEGNFFDSAREGFEPQMTVGKQPVELLKHTTLELAFSIPSAAVQTQGSGTTYIPATLTVPYRRTCYLLFKCREGATFTFLLVATPPHPGTLTFKVTKSVPGVERALKTGAAASHKQHSDKDDIPNPSASGFQQCDQPDAGWRVEVATVQPIVDWSQGDQGEGKDWWFNGNTSNLSNACWNLTTIHHGLGTSGKVDFHFTFFQQRDIVQAVANPVEAQLEWGSTRLFEVPTGATWVATFEQFDGKKIDINSGHFDNPYLHLTTSGNSVLFTTIP